MSDRTPTILEATCSMTLCTPVKEDGRRWTHGRSCVAKNSPLIWERTPLYLNLSKTRAAA